MIRKWACKSSTTGQQQSTFLAMTVSEITGTIHSTKVQTGLTGKRGPPQKVDQIFGNFSGWTEPIHWVLDRNFWKFWLNGSHPTSVILPTSHSVTQYVSQLASQPASESVNQSVSWPVSLSVSQSVSQQSSGQPVCQSVGQSISWSASQPVS